MKRILTGLAAAALVGCAAGTGSTGPHSSPSATAQVGPTWSNAAPTPGGGDEAHSGRMTFAFPSSEIDHLVEPTGCFVGMGEVQVPDPRVAGGYRTIICWGQEEGAFLGVWTIWNDGGTWDGPHEGNIDAVGNHVMDSEMQGSGEHAALRLMTRSRAGSDDSIWEVEFAVTAGAPSSPPPSMSPPAGATAVTGTSSCGPVVIDALEESVGDGVEHRGEIAVCTWSTSDDRFTGPHLTSRSTDLRADGSAASWGAVALQVGEGTWLGAYDLKRTADGTTVETSLIGFDAYRGLAYRGVEFGAGDTWQLSGWIEPVD